MTTCRGLLNGEDENGNKGDGYERTRTYGSNTMSPLATQDNHRNIPIVFKKERMQSLASCKGSESGGEDLFSPGGDNATQTTGSNGKKKNIALIQFPSYLASSNKIDSRDQRLLVFNSMDQKSTKSHLDSEKDIKRQVSNNRVMSATDRLEENSAFMSGTVGSLEGEKTPYAPATTKNNTSSYQVLKMPSQIMPDENRSSCSSQVAKQIEMNAKNATTASCCSPSQAKVPSHKKSGRSSLNSDAQYSVNLNER